MSLVYFADRLVFCGVACFFAEWLVFLWSGLFFCGVACFFAERIAFDDAFWSAFIRGGFRRSEGRLSEQKDMVKRFGAAIAKADIKWYNMLWKTVYSWRKVRTVTSTASLWSYHENAVAREYEILRKNKRRIASRVKNYFRRRNE